MVSNLCAGKEKTCLSVEEIVAETGLQALSAGDLRMLVDPQVGARIVSFTRAGVEMLSSAAVHPDNYGSTFWDSPQSAWGWPPRAVLDSGPYTVVSSAGTLELVSQVDPSGLQFSKRIHANVARSCIEIEYRMLNHGQAPLKVGPWEITRVPGGLSFFPHEEVPGLPPTVLEPVSYENGICWYDFDAALLAQGRKLFSGAKEGWLAHVGPERMLFVKTFLDTQPADYAPEQGEVEIWGNDGGNYVELENHGQYRELPPGEAHSYRVDWHMVKLPDDIEVRPGNPALVKLARQVAGVA